MILYGRQKCVAEEAPTLTAPEVMPSGVPQLTRAFVTQEVISFWAGYAALIEVRKARFRHALEFAISLTPWPPHAKS